MNKKSISGLLAVVMIAAVAALNVSLNSQKETLSDLAMENVEALAVELPETGITCSYPHCSFGYLCHRNTGTFTCYCEFTGKAADKCQQ